MKKALLFAVVISLFTACNNTSKSPSNSDNETNTNVDSTSDYRYQGEFTTLKWTAFKTSARLPVGGAFTNFDVSPGKAHGSVTSLLNGLKFKINVSSSNSGDEGRDQKIAKFFYGKMVGTTSISGTITEVKGDDVAGMATISITMNEVTHEINAPYALSDKTLRLNAMIQLGDWKAKRAIKSLNKVCKDLHTGEDGVSKLWPEVEVAVESILIDFEPVIE
jgi:YceI-like domain